jgi:hypothetical protein
MDKRISQLELVTELDENDVLPIVNGGTTKKIKISQLASVNTNLSYTPSPTNGKVNSDTGTDATIPLTNETDAGLFSSAQKTKLDGIQAGAEVNINPDWNATTGKSKILNKPTIPASQVNSDWNASTGVEQILNKPTVPSKTSDLTNDSGFITSAQVPTVNDATATVKGIVKLAGDLGGSADAPTVPTLVNKVDKVTGKGLSANDFTDTLKTKLDGIQDGAEVNVNADWNATSGDAQILNKPTIPSAVTQTNQLTNNGADGVNPFITALDIPTTGQASTLVREVKNMTGATLTKGTVVFISGANGNKPLVSKALATTDALSSRTFGLLQSNISNNGLGYCVIIGDLSGLDTSSFAEGAQLYLSGVTAGTYTATKTLAPTHLVYVGKVTRSHPTQGQIEVGIQNGYELSEIHDVALSSEADNQVLAYESSTDLWKNKSIGTILGFTPYRYVDTARVNVSGTLNESILNTIVINPNTFNTTDLMKVMWKNAKTTSLGTVNIRLRSNTTNSLVGATLLATSSMGTTNRTAVFLRNFDLIAGTINGFDSGTAIASDITVSTSNPSSNVYNTNNVLYLFVTIQLTNVGDTVTSNFVNITN